MNNKRILILGHTFNNGSAGITMKSLFSNWDKSQLYCASQGDLSSAIQFNSFYKYGCKEIKSRFPFSLIYKFREKSGTVDVNREVAVSKIVIDNKTSNKRGFYEKYLSTILKKTKIYYYRLSYTASTELIDWIKAVNPDVIYAVIGDLEDCRLLNGVMENFPKIKLVTHFLDDWMDSMPSQVLLPKRYSKNLDKELQKLFNYSSANLSISEQMSDAFKVRYGHDFIPFHNPIDKSDFDIEREAPIRECKVITYIGKINDDNVDSINDVIEAVDRLVSKEYKLHFNIYPNYNTKQSYLDLNIRKGDNLRILPSIPHNMIAKVLINESDILLLPMSFKNESIKYVKYSISTKLIEYLASQTPLLLYAPLEIAISEFCITNDCASSLNTRSISQLEQMILSILNRDQDIEDKILRGYNLSMKYFTKDIVCTRFDHVLNNI